NSALAGSPLLEKEGPNALTLGGTSTYSGGTRVTGGSILFTTGSALGTGTVQLGTANFPAGTDTSLLAAGATNTTLANDILVLDDGATIGSVDDAVNNPAVNFTGTITNNAEGSGQLFLMGGSGGGTTFGGRITGTGQITATATAPGRRVVLDNGTATPNDFAGAVTIKADAVLQLGATTTNEQIPDAATVHFASAAATLGLFQMTETFTAVTSDPVGAGVIQSQGGNSTLVLAGGGGSGSFGGTVIDGAGMLGLVKIGPGPQLFRGNITISRGVTESGGPLILDGTVNAAVSVIYTGPLQGTGTLAGPVTVGDHGVLVPGLYLVPDSMTISGTVTFQAGSQFQPDVQGAAAGQYDVLNVTGSATLGGTLWVVQFAALMPVGTVLTIVSGPGTVTGTFDGLPEGAIYHPFATAQQYRISYTGGDGNDVTLTVVPSMATVLTASSNPATLGQPVTFTATIVTPTGGTPTGSVTFLVDGVTLGTADVSATGQASFTTASLGSGDHTVVAQYGGDSTFSPSTSPTLTLTVAAPGPGERLAVGGNPDGSVSVYDTPDSSGLYTRTATVSPFAGLPAGLNVRTASADVDGDGASDVVVVTGPGTPIRVAVVSGADNKTVLVPAFDPFGDNFTGGGFVAALDIDADGKAEFVVTPDQGGGPRVSIFSLVNGARSLRANFFGIDDPNFRGGARAALGDVNKDGTPDLAVAAGFLGGPRVALFNGTTLFGTPTRLISDFFAFPGADAQTLRNGVFVALGDMNGDAFADLMFGGGPGGAPRVFVLSGARVVANDVAGAQETPLVNFFVAGNSADRGGVRVAAKDGDGDNRADIVTGSGERTLDQVRVYYAANFPGASEPSNFQSIIPFGIDNLPGGVFVG
ncbi:MAG TPA: Ig-like domain repeat protein, partial [Gemmataceae bacterium]|nr:Ig-like domain repeat protein [Gemmataceae bacterium]